MDGYYFNRHMHSMCGVYFTVVPDFDDDETLATDEKYPLLATIESLREVAAGDLRKRGFTDDDFFRAARHVRLGIYQTLDAIVTGPDEKTRAKFQVGGISKPDENYFEWLQSSYFLGAIDLAEEALLRTPTKTNTPSRALEWLDIILVATLWCVDEAVFHLNNNQPYKAGVWVTHGYQCIHEAEWQSEDDDAHTLLSRKGGDAKNADYLLMKGEAIRLYDEKAESWKSRLQAAKTITPKIEKFAVEKGLSRRLTTTRGQTTVYEWLGDHVNKQK